MRTIFSFHRLCRLMLALLLCSPMFFFKHSTSQSLQWVNTILGNNLTTTVCLVSDNTGNSYQTGRFYSLVDFDAGAGIDTMNAAALSGNLNSYGAYVSKTDAAGNHVWAKSFIAQNNGSQSIGMATSVDNSGSVIAIGTFKGLVDFDPGPGLDTLSASTLYDMPYIVKLDVNGNYVWATKFQNTLASDYNNIYAVLTDASNNIYVAGAFAGTVDFDLHAGVYNVTAPSISNYLLKLDGNGNLIWLKTWDNSNNDINAAGNRILAIDNSNNLYLCLSVSAIDTLDIDPGPVVDDQIGENFLVKIDSAGNFVWGGANTASTMQVHVDRFGAIYTTGSFALGADIDPGPGTYVLNAAGDLYITKSDPGGNLTWSKSVEQASTYHLTTDTSGNIFCAWSSGATAIDCDPDTSEYVLHGTGSKYILCGFDSAGVFQWAKKTSWTNVCNNTGLRINVTPANDLMVAGRICHILDIDFGPAVYNIGQMGGGHSFLMKYNYCGATQTMFYAACDSLALPDTTYLSSADFVREYLDVNNCDSNVNIHVAILTQQNEHTLYGCDTVNYLGQIYAQTGTYTQIVPNGIGCDSVHTLHVYINTPTGQTPFLNQIQTFQPFHPPLATAFMPLSYAIEIDSLYNLYIAGTFSNEVNFNPLGTPYTDTSFGAYLQPDGFITRYDSSGTLSWMHQMFSFDVWGNEYTPSICLNDNLDLYSVTYGKGGANIGLNTEKIFSYANNYYGQTQLGGYSVMNVSDVFNDPVGILPIKVGFLDSIDFNYAYKKLIVWRGNNSAVFAAPGQFYALNGTADAFGNIYVVCNYQPVFGGNLYCSIVKLDSNLNMLWNKIIAEGNDVDGLRILRLKVDTAGSLLLCGRFADTLDIDISPNNFTMISQGGLDAFVARFDTAANFLWANSFGGSDDDFANTLTTDLFGRIYVGGNFFSPHIDLDPSAGIAFYLKGCASAVWNGGYISRFKPDGTFSKAMGSGQTITELEFKAPKRIYATGIPFVQVFELTNDTIVNNIVDICAGDSVTVGNSVYYQTGIYSDIFMSAQGGDSIVVTILTVNALPQPLLVFSGDTLYCTNVSGNNIRWYLNNVLIDSMINYHVLTQNGTYAVMVEDTNGCMGYDTLMMSNLPVANQIWEDFIQVYPNPFHHALNIVCYTNGENIAEFSINTLLGETVYFGNKGMSLPGRQVFHLDLNQINLSPGLYVLTIKIGDQRHMVKITCQE